MKRILSITLALMATSFIAFADQRTVNCGDQVKVTATPAEGYHFVKWSDGSLEPARIIEPASDTTLTAYFAINTYAITATGENGTVTGAGTYEHGATATLTATPAHCYRFVRWSDGDTHATRQVTVTAAADYVAEFEIIKYNVVITSEQESKGSVSVTVNP